MLTRPRRVLLAAWLAALTAAPVLAVGTASAAQADVVRSQELWVLNAMDVLPAWQTTMGSGVTVAVIDSGVNKQVSDLAGSVTEGKNFTGVNTPPSDPHWGVHGTWMASLIAGHGHPAGGPNGIVGVAPKAHILSVRAVTDQGDPGDRHYERESENHVQNELADAIDYAVGRHVQVISMSLGYQGASLPVRVAIAHALARGIVVVASSGNSGGARTAHGHAPYSFPANYPGVLGVAAISRSGTPANFSSNNLSVEVAAPGVKVPAQGRDGQYWLVSGTSPACALTAGVAALVKARYPAMPPALVDQAITDSARHRPHGGYNEEVGFGTVDAVGALQMAAKLVHDGGAGRGASVAARFGGGPSAIPELPVAPRGRSLLIADMMLGVVCLALVLASAVWLIVTRGRPARPAWPGAVQPASGMGGYGPPVGYGSYGPPSGPATGYGPPAGYGPSAGYGPPTRPVSGYGPPSGQPSAPYGPPSSPYRPPSEPYWAPSEPYGAPSVPYGTPPGPPPGQGPPAGPPAGPERPGGYRSSAGHDPPPEEPPGPAGDFWSRPDEW